MQGWGWWRGAVIVAGLAVGLAACAPAPLAVPPPPEFDQAHDAVAQADAAALAAVKPDAVPIFQAADEALYNQKNWRAAETGFKQVLTMAPEFGPALRQLSHVVR